MRPGAPAILALALAMLAGPADRASAADRAGCRVVRGRLAVWNGTPAVRIWPVGTRRELGVVDPAGDAAGERLLPAAVERLLHDAPERTVVFGNYRVCALSRARPGHMQIVYIVSARRLNAVAR